jgi:magnesium chelatase subunit I
LVKKKKNEPNPYGQVITWFSKNELEIPGDLTENEHRKLLLSVPGLQKLVSKYSPGAERDDETLLMEFVLHGLAEHSLLGKNVMDEGLTFSDLFSSVFSMDDFEEGEYGQ